MDLYFGGSDGLGEGALGESLYDACGNPRATTGASPNPFGFTGHERDDETGLYYFKARFYDPEVGRFLREDPFEGTADNPPSLHRYLYAFGNPTVFIDPTGEIAVLSELQDDLEELSEEVLDADPGLLQGQIDRAVIRATNSALLSLGARAAGLVNFVTNRVVAQVAPNSELAKQARDEIAATDEKIQQFFVTAIERVEEDPAGTVRSVVETPSMAARAVLDKALSADELSEREVTELLAGGLELGAESAVGAAAVTRLRRLGRVGVAATEEGAAARAAGGGTTKVGGLSRLEQGVVREAQEILASPEFAKLRAAQARGRSLEVRIGNRTILLEPRAPVSGMTLLGENGFVIGGEAFASEAEISKTLLQELFRLETSAARGGRAVSQALATAERDSAFEFAERAFEVGNR